MESIDRLLLVISALSETDGYCLHQHFLVESADSSIVVHAEDLFVGLNLQILKEVHGFLRQRLQEFHDVVLHLGDSLGFDVRVHREMIDNFEVNGADSGKKLAVLLRSQHVPPEEMVECAEKGGLVELQLVLELLVFLLHLLDEVTLRYCCALFADFFGVVLHLLVEENVGVGAGGMVSPLVSHFLPAEGLPADVAFVEEGDRLVIEFEPFSILLYQRVVVASF